MKPVKIHLLTVLLFIGSTIPVHSHAQHPVAYLYKNDNRSAPITRFSPTDTIGLLVILKDLDSGEYTFHADWYNAAGKLQETSRHRFTKTPGHMEVIDARLEMIKASPLKRLFSSTESTGYHMTFYGKWRVEVFLNGKPVASKNFEVK